MGYKDDPAANCHVANRIDDETQCRLAGAAVGHPFGRSMSSTERPAGCFWDQNTGLSHLNTNSGASATWGGVGGLCKLYDVQTPTTAEYFLAPGGESCTQACDNRGQQCHVDGVIAAAESVDK